MIRRAVYQVILLLSIGWYITFAHAPISYAASDSVLGSKAVQTFPASELPRWNFILQTHLLESSHTRSIKIQNWKNFIRSIQNDYKIRQLLKVNLWFKQFPYKQDNWVYKKDDYWATPAEFLEKGGDCEDYAIAKYMTLRQLGFPAKDMKIVMVYNAYSGTDHAFLVVNYDGAEFVLDNKEKLVVARYMKNRYKPYYAFNEEKVWAYDSPLVVQKIRRNNNGQILPGNR